MLNSNKEVIKISKDTKEDIKSFIKIFIFLFVIPIVIGVIGGTIEANLKLIIMEFALNVVVIINL